MWEYETGCLFFVFGAGLIGAFIDAVVGGGGLVTTPALLAVGLPVATALGSNKLGSVFGTFTSAFTFWRHNRIDKKTVMKLVPLSFLGSGLGAYLVYLLPEKLMKNIVVLALVVVAVYTYRRKDWGDVNKLKDFTSGVAVLVVTLAFGLGFYDGFFGPGTGSFLIFMFLYLGFNFVFAAGNAKALNLASGLGALLVFSLTGSINIPYALTMASGQIIGARMGAKLAIAKGASYVKPLYLTVTTLLIGKQVYDLLFK